jgi:hypothetical protein
MEPHLGRIEMPSMGLPRLDRALAKARERKQAGPAESSASTASAPSTATARQEPAVPAPAPAVPAVARRPPPPLVAAPASTSAVESGVPPPLAGPPGAAFAVSTRLLRTRAESEQTMAAMRALLLAAGARTVQVEIVAAGDDWRVVVWPYHRRADAEKARSQLAARGMRVQVIDF